jgi:glycosyltransferase involved in cell wall biosynthesis
MNTPTYIPDASVVIASYNMAQYLGAAIQSVLDQSVGSVEVFVVDDGSTDNTRAIVAPFLSDPRVTYLFQENAGQTKAKNAGARRARGRYIGFCDADDMWDTNKLELQLPLLDANLGVAVAYTRTREIDENGALLTSPVYSEYSGWVCDRLFIENFVPFGSALVRRSAFEAVGGFDEELRMGIDWDLWLRLSVDNQFLAIPQEAYFYRVWTGQMSKNWKGRYEAAFHIMARFLAAHPGLIDPVTVKTAISNSYLNRAYARCSLSEDRVGALVDCLRSVRAGGSIYGALKLAVKISLRLPLSGK